MHAVGVLLHMPYPYLPLTRNVLYVFRVSARNRFGAGPEVQSNAERPPKLRRVGGQRAQRRARQPLSVLRGGDDEEDGSDLEEHERLTYRRSFRVLVPRSSRFGAQVT